MLYTDKNIGETYCAPFLGNGKLSLQITPDGAMNPNMRGGLIKAYPSASIWVAGRRSMSGNRGLLCHGRFEQQLLKADATTDASSHKIDAQSELAVAGFTQELDAEHAVVNCHTEYSDGSVVDTTAFVDTEYKLIILKKRIIPADKLNYRFSYSFCGKGKSDVLPDLCDAAVSVGDNSGRISYRLTDRKDFGGSICVGCECDCRFDMTANSVILSRLVDEPTELCFYIALSDSLDGADHAGLARDIIQSALNDGFESLKARHDAAWRDYYAEGGAAVGDSLCDDVYLTAQYHLKIFATEWSLPVGLCDSCWESKFFAFDEHYMFFGLLTSNHTREASCVPYFRHAGLESAIKRVSSKHHNAARYPWETLEDGSEASPYGYWYEHIFHMSTIPLTEYYYYLYTNDLEFLRDVAYPVISACAEFFYVHALYRVEGKGLIVGKCTDLERLGSGVENAYMTTCGVVSTFRVFAEVARLLGRDTAIADEYLALADELMRNLPDDGERYIPYPGCTERSISAYSGTFPFDVIARDDKLQTAAIDDYVKYEDTFGNMYEIGSGVCSWYACWKALVFARLGRADEAVDALRRVAGESGWFGELFEINNDKSQTYIHPWFTTAAGMFVHAMNECLLSCHDGKVYIAPALDRKHDSFSFRLLAHGGVVVECEVKDSRIISLSAHAVEHCAVKSIRVNIPERFDTIAVAPDGAHEFSINVG